MTRLTTLSGICALTLLGFLPVSSRADGLLGCRGGGWQGVNHGSYSPLHYWLPSIYTCRAYHRPGNSYEQYVDVEAQPPSHSTPGPQGGAKGVPMPGPDDSRPKRLPNPDEPKK
jgi:hypothetical protein